MSHDKAMIRELVERIDGVTRTWFELEIEGGKRTKTLVVEVSFDLDRTHLLRAACDEIEDTFATVLREEKGDVISKLKIVNKAERSAERHSAESERRPRRASSEAEAA